MQKFNKGDYVQIAKDLGESMSHFTSDCEAIVIGSYADQYGGSDTNSYTLHIKGEGRSSWYYGEQLELIEADRIELLEQWEQEEKEMEVIKSNLDWIFANGKEVLEKNHGATVSALAKCFGLTNLWGSNGEGITYYSNAMTTMQLAKPFLEAGDKEGWFSYCKTIEV